MKMIALKDAHEQFKNFLKEKKHSTSTIVAYGKDIDQLVKFLAEISKINVHEVAKEDLEAFLAKLSKQGFTLKTISRKINSTRTFYRFLKVNEYITDDPSLLINHPRYELAPPRILTPTEYRALRDAARDDVRSYAMIEVLIQTGVTISELAGMKIEHLSNDTEKGKLFVPDFNNKLHRTIPLNKAVIEAVTNYLEKERPKQANAMHLFITKTGRPMLVRNIRSTINRYFKLAGVEKAKVNDLRHTFVAHHLSNGVSIIHISKIAGHKRISTTERYLQYIDRNVEEEKTELGIL